ncbi:MAG: GTPase [Candidatus Aenigmatarchaeota archaeon]
MPANLPREWFILEEEMRNTKSIQEKIEKLERLIALTPKHKGTENLRAQLNKRLAKLRNEMEKSSRKEHIKSKFEKNGDVLVSILGFTQIGKSTLLKNLTNASVEISNKPYTTKEIESGICKWNGVSIQFVEIPSFFLKRHLAVAKTSDLLVLLVRDEEDLKKLEYILNENNFAEKKKIVLFSNFLKNLFEVKDFSEFLNKILEEVNVFRIFTKPPKKEVSKDALVFKLKPKVRDVLKRINESFLETFKFAKVFRKKEIKRVGLDYELEDGDIIEVHA